MNESLPAKANQPALQANRPATVDWETVYQAQMPRIYNFLRYRLHDELVAEDLTAVTFEKAWRHRHSYQPHQAAFTTWLFTIARNAATDYLRRQQEHDPLPETAVSPTPTPEETISHQQSLAFLHQLLADLPDREQEILALKYGAELSHRDIARQMGLTAVNVGIILYRTLRKLRPLLQEK
ncbi:MAG: sigma-70 family RNA polymerase sigma factor [Ardenticatenaceae bacterium]|nr:sigma-70 family RNA polymerase sigma factor [Ardenticatenaceae bacterium]